MSKTNRKDRNPNKGKQKYNRNRVQRCSVVLRSTYDRPSHDDTMEFDQLANQLHMEEDVVVSHRL